MHFTNKTLYPIGLNPFKTTKSLSLIIMLVISVLFTTCGVKSDPSPALEGFWTPEKYLLESGESKPVSGHISFGKNQWSVVFFILDDEGKPLSASAEGGEYSLENNNLIFWHSYNFSDVSKGDVTELTKTISRTENRQKEFCTIEIEDDLLAIYFPSGNAMIFSRSS